MDAEAGTAGERDKKKLPARTIIRHNDRGSRFFLWNNFIYLLQREALDNECMLKNRRI